MTPDVNVTHDVFVSYSSKDAAAADAVRVALEGRGVRCWIAPRDILPGLSWPAAIVQAIGRCRAMLLVFSGNANDSEQIKREISQAVSRGMPILPVRIEDVQPSGDLAYFLSTPHWMDAFAPPLESHLEALATTVRAILGRDAQPGTPPPSARNRGAAPARRPHGSGRRVAPYVVLSAAALFVVAAGLFGGAWVVRRLSTASPPPPVAAGGGTGGAETGGRAAGPRGAGTRDSSGAEGGSSGSRGTPTGQASPAAPAASPSPAVAATVPVPTARAATAPSVTFADRKPGADAAAPAALGLGEVVAGELADSGWDKPAPPQFWQVDLPPGRYKVVWDMTLRTDDYSAFGGWLHWVTPDGEKAGELLYLNDVGHRSRSVARFSSNAPFKRALRVSNKNAAAGYRIGLFREDQPVPVPFFDDSPEVRRIAPGQSSTAALDGDDPRRHAAYFAAALPAGEYKVAAEFRLAGGEASNVGGSVDVLDREGVVTQTRLVSITEVAASARGSATLSLAEASEVIFRVRANYPREIATLVVTRVAAE